MVISQQDMTELKRFSTNTYDEDKALVNRIIKGIADYESVIRALKAENVHLKAQLETKNAAKP